MKARIRFTTLMVTILAFGLFRMGMAAPDESKLVGTWQGALDVGAMKLRLVFDIKAEQPGKLSGTLDSPDQHAFGLPIDAIGLNGDEVKIELVRIGGTFSGVLSPDVQQIAGMWSQVGQSFPLTLRRGEKIEPARRPQEPKPPFPYDAEEISYESPKDRIRIAGTLTRPRGAERVPAVLLITGSGPQDRDETLLGHKPFLVIADSLTRNGFAVLRVDDRGVGGSMGNVMQSTLDDFKEDALAGVFYLRNRKDIGRIGLIGHSEGGAVAALAANDSPDVAFVVLIASPGVRIDELLVQQLHAIGSASGMSQRMLAFSESIQREIFAIIRSTPDDQTATARLEAMWAERKADAPSAAPASADEKHLSTFEATLKAQAKMLVTPWFRDLIDHDPAVALRRLRCPVLVMLGELDVQVPPAKNLPALEAALKQAGNRDVTLMKLPGLNHLMQTAKTGLPEEYGRIEETFSPVALRAIDSWLRAQTEGHHGQGE